MSSQAFLAAFRAVHQTRSHCAQNSPPIRLFSTDLKVAKVVIFPLTIILGTHPDEFLLVVGAGYENHSGTEQVFDRDFRVVRSVRLLSDYVIQILKHLDLWTIIMIRSNLPEKQTCVSPQGRAQRRWCQGSGHAPNSQRCPRRSASTRGRPPGSPCSRR